MFRDIMDRVFITANDRGSTGNDIPISAKGLEFPGLTKVVIDICISLEIDSSTCQGSSRAASDDGCFLPRLD